MKKQGCIFISCSLLFVSLFIGGCTKTTDPDPKPFVLDRIDVQGDLRGRISANMDYIEEQPFWPKNIFAASDTSGWSGGLEGRALLAWVSDGQAIKRNPVYAEPMVEQLSGRFNDEGYVGPVIKDGVLNEQQMAGNSWMLRGLCAYYQWTLNTASKEKVRGYIQSIVQNLFLANKGSFQEYPVIRDSLESLASPETGIIVRTEGKWMLSSDVGCVFVALDGLSDAYSVLQDTAIKEVFNELASRFLAMDLLKVQAHTHSSLSAMRGLLRYASLTGERKFIADVQRLWTVFSKTGMSENYGVFNWLGRYDTWSDPNAVVDAYMLSSQLWALTRDVRYLEDAELIYVNALAQAQRSFGGFGSDNNPLASNFYITSHTIETSSGTLRGAEGLSAAVSYGYFAKDDTLFVPFLGSSDAHFVLDGAPVTIHQESEYPLKSVATFSVFGKTSAEFVLLLPVRSWDLSCSLKINGVITDAPVKNGFMEVSGLQNGDRLEYSRQRKIAVCDPVSIGRALPDQFRYMYGSMLLCYNYPDKVIFTRQSKIIPTEPGFFAIERLDLEVISVFRAFTKADYDPFDPPKRVLF